MGNYQLNGETIPVPNTFHIEEIDIRRDSRVTSGLMVTDFITVKKRFILDYVLLKGSDLQTILDELYDDVFAEFTYPDHGGSETVTVTKHHVPRRLWANPTAPLEKVYRDIYISLIER